MTFPGFFLEQHKSKKRTKSSFPNRLKTNFSTQSNQELKAKLSTKERLLKVSNDTKAQVLFLFR